MNMDKDKIFELFDSKEEENEKTSPLDLPYNEAYKNIGMFTKLILNHFTFHDKLQKFLQQEAPSYNVESTKEASAFVVYNRAWYYLHQVDPNNKETVFTLLEFDYSSLYHALESALHFFEEKEEYEKCAHIFKIQNILKESKR